MRIPVGLVLALACMSLVVMIGCEGDTGPAGPQGPAGDDGQDAQVTCLSCHNTTTLEDNTIELNRSQHGLGEYVGYAGGNGGCARCHSGNGFVEFATNGEVAGDIVVPTAWECNTCHGLHTTFDEEFTEDMDYALRLTDPVTALFDGTTVLDLENSANLCMNCHQSRRGMADYDDGTGTTVNITSSHAGPHHGPQANLLFGNNGATEGTPFTPHVAASCVACHMYETTGDDMDVKGGHTFWPSPEACSQTGCHASVRTDFDRAGIQTEISEKLETLGDLLVGEGILEWDVDEDTGDSSRSLVTGEYDREVFQAFWNWVFIEEDRSKGVHNPTYANELLDNAIDAMDGVPNA